MKPDQTSAPATTKPAPHPDDNTKVSPLVQRVQARRAELIQLRDAIPEANVRERGDLDIALAGADTMLTGDLVHPAEPVTIEMSRWLENNKHLAEKTPKA